MNADRTSQIQKKCYNFSTPVVCQCSKSNLKCLNKSNQQCRTFANLNNVDLDETVLKIQELVNDPVACEYSSRICTLMYKFLHVVGEKGFYLKHLSAVSDILEFLARKVKYVNDYQIHLDRLLEIICQPIILDKSSAIRSSTAVVEQYFTTLGSLLMILPTRNQILKIFRALRCLLSQSKSIFNAAIPTEICHQAVEKSQLPFILVRLIQISPSYLYIKVLDLSFILVSVSSVCCRIFLLSGVLEHLLIRLPSDEPRLTPVPPGENSVLKDKEDYYEEMVLATNIMWALVKVVLSPEDDFLDVEKIPALSENAVRSLRWTFRREIFRSQRSRKSTMMRNDLACLILAGIASLPFWKLINSGLADDIALLLAVEVQFEKSWASDVKLTSSNEDLFFKKVLLFIVSFLTESEAAVNIMINRHVLPVVLELVNPEDKTIRSNSQFCYLAQYALNTLTFLAPKMPKEFIKHQGSFRLTSMIESAMINGHEILINLVKTVCSIMTQNCPLIVEDFCEKGVIRLAIELFDRVLNCDTITTQDQRFLTFLVIIMEEAMNNYQEIYGKESIKLILRFLQRCFHQKKGEFLLDQRILISTGSFLWQSIVNCPFNDDVFIKMGAVYLLLDIMEDASFSVRCVYLGLLSDMCQKAFCASHLCTWRGNDKTKGFMSLLAETWREEEKIIGLKRTIEGCLLPYEIKTYVNNNAYLAVPLTGDIFSRKYESHFNQFRDLSPTLFDMIGSVRPKIYNIIEMTKKDYEETRKHKILMHDVPAKDEITLCIVEKYLHLKKAEVWIEVARFLEESGLHSLDDDVFVAIKKHQRLAMDIKEKQEKILGECRKKELVKEKENFTRIRESTLAPALTALKEIDFIRKTTQKSYKDQQEYQRAQFVEKSLHFPPDAVEKNCHRMNRYFMEISRQSYSFHDPEMLYLDNHQNNL